MSRKNVVTLGEKGNDFFGGKKKAKLKSKSKKKKVKKCEAGK